MSGHTLSTGDPLRQRRLVLCMVLLSSFLAPFMGSAVNIALPSIGREFGLDAVTLNWIATAYLLSSCMFLLPLGKLADLKGRKKIFTIGIIIFTFGCLCCGLASSTAFLLASRVLQGIGAAMIFSTGVAILTAVYPTQERGRVLGYSVAVVYLGLSVGPFLGGILTQYLTWRSIFLVPVPIGIFVAFCGTAKVTGEERTASIESFDFVGAITYALSLLLFIYSLAQLPQSGYLGMLCGIGGLIAFILWEIRTPHPLLDLTLFTRNRIFAFSNLAALIHYSATFSQGFFLSLYLQYINGLSPQAAGLILIASPVVMTIVSPLAGRLSDTIAPRIIASSGMAITALSLWLLTSLHADSHLLFLVATLIISGFGFALFSSPNTNAVMSAVDKRDYGIASGVLATMRMTGQTLSMAAAMLFFALFLGKAPINATTAPAFLTTLHTAFTCFTVLCLLGTLASLARGKQA